MPPFHHNNQAPFLPVPNRCVQLLFKKALDHFVCWSATVKLGPIGCLLRGWIKNNNMVLLIHYLGISPIAKKKKCFETSPRHTHTHSRTSIPCRKLSQQKGTPSVPPLHEAWPALWLVQFLPVHPTRTSSGNLWNILVVLTFEAEDMYCPDKE